MFSSLQSMEEKPPSWKKLSAVSQASSNPGTMAVKMQRSYHLNDEDETEVETDNKAKGRFTISQRKRNIQCTVMHARIINYYHVTNAST